MRPCLPAIDEQWLSHRSVEAQGVGEVRMDRLVGQQLDAYRLLDLLGIGGMAAVYRAYEPSMDRHVAIKVLRDHLAGDATFRARFEREVRTLARLEHQHILPVYDVGEHGGRPYLVMRYVEGGTLGDVLARSRMGLEQATKLAIQVAEALGYAHRQGVIHRDVKPSNILITPDGDALLTDFGIAKLLAQTLGLTGEGMQLGTPLYMAPEQVQGQTVDGRTDVYALGVVLYEALAGRPPYVAETPMAVALMHVRQPPPPLRQHNRAIPEALEQVLLRALAKQPDDRFQTALEFATALRSSLSSTVLPSRQPQTESAAPGVHDDRKRLRRWLPIAVGGVVLLVIAGTIGFVGSFRRTEPPSTVMVPQTPATAGALVGGGVPVIGNCPVFPADNVWNAPIKDLPIDPSSNAYITSIGREAPLHREFGSGLYEGETIGVPFTVVSTGQARVPVKFGEEAADESDPGPYPIPADAKIEGGPASTGDRHVLLVDQGNCKLYEIYDAHPNNDGSWGAYSGAIFDLRSNALRPENWTSANAAGLPMTPGLLRHDEVAAGAIRHALAFTAPHTRKQFVWPGRHFASSQADTALPPMGQRFRLKASVDVSRFSHDSQVILTALQTYGMFLVDNGASWFLLSEPHDGWDNDRIQDEFKQIRGSDFEAVDESSLRRSDDSAQVKR